MKSKERNKVENTLKNRISEFEVKAQLQMIILDNSKEKRLKQAVKCFDLAFEETPFIQDKEFVCNFLKRYIQFLKENELFEKLENIQKTLNRILEQKQCSQNRVLRAKALCLSEQYEEAEINFLRAIELYKSKENLLSYVSFLENRNRKKEAKVIKEQLKN